MIGKTISHYKIQEKIGEGGRGVVYKAEDMKLKRIVVLKFLPPELTRDQQAKERFIHEAQASAALDHPNICTVHEIDEVEGKIFISMAYIKGQSLKDKIVLGPLEIQEAIDIVTQVAVGLNEAHEKGIVHRDIKPANIMLTDKGQAKIMDFGLAKLAWGMDITKTATIMGTVAYMSPEQAKGEKVDHRTDIWSLGCVLYEMLSGEKPFKSTHEQAAIYAILHEEPDLLTSLRPDIPKSIEKSVMKAMEKDPSRRYQNIQEFIQELTSISSTTWEISEEKSIVVLPFEDISPGKDNEYFCDGMTEEIISDLSKVHTLKVISRSSAMTFKGTKKKVRQIAEEVDVQYVLEGSVRKAGNNLRITAQLIDATNDAHLWASKYSGTLDDIFDIQEKVSRSIVHALKLKLTPKEKQRIEEKPITDIQAYEFYLKAWHEIWRFSEDSLDRALYLLEQALKITGDNEYLYAAKGTVYWQYVNALLKSSKNYDHYLQEAEENAKKVFRLNPVSTVGHVLMANIHNNRGNQKECVFHSKKALEQNRSNPHALMWLGWIYTISGRESVGRPLLKKAAELDPLSPVIVGCYSWVDIYEGNFEIASEGSYKAYKMEEKNPMFRWWYAYTLAYTGDLAKSISLVDSIGIKSPQSVFEFCCMFQLNAWSGNKERALRYATSDLIDAAKWDDIYSMLMTECFSLINERERALQWLEHTIDYGIINYPFLSKRNPFLENIRGEERFKKLMKRVKHEWENFEV